MKKKKKLTSKEILLVSIDRTRERTRPRSTYFDDKSKYNRNREKARMRKENR